jgi:hypothetical protein
MSTDTATAAVKPQRIQLRRTKGWRKPENTVVVARPSRFGNPYRVGRDGTAAECVAKFEQLLAKNIWTEPNLTSIREELRGRNLACWCREGSPCHASVLLRIANA